MNVNTQTYFRNGGHEKKKIGVQNKYLLFSPVIPSDCNSRFLTRRLT